MKVEIKEHARRCGKTAALKPKHFVIPYGVPIVVKKPPMYADRLYINGIEVPPANKPKPN